MSSSNPEVIIWEVPTEQLNALINRRIAEALSAVNERLTVMEVRLARLEKEIGTD